MVLLGVSAIAALLPVTIDGLRFHLAQLVAVTAGSGDASMDSLASVAIAAATLACLLRFTVSISRRWRAQRDIALALRCEPRRVLDGIAYVSVPAPGVRVFTGGFVRPTIYVSGATEDLLSRGAFRAVLGHEASHVRRRDPLRLALAAALVDAFGWVPGVRASVGQHAMLAELAADAAVVRTTGDRSALSQALLEMDALAQHGAGVLPQRVDQLVGDLDWRQASQLALFAGIVVLAGLSLLAVAVTVAPSHPTVYCTLLLFAASPILLLPAALAARRACLTLRCR